MRLRWYATYFQKSYISLYYKLDNHILLYFFTFMCSFNSLWQNNKLKLYCYRCMTDRAREHDVMTDPPTGGSFGRADRQCGDE